MWTSIQGEIEPSHGYRPVLPGPASAFSALREDLNFLDNRSDFCSLDGREVFLVVARRRQAASQGRGFSRSHLPRAANGLNLWRSLRSGFIQIPSRVRRRMSANARGTH